MALAPARWYQTTWGILLLGLAGTILVIAASFIILTLRYASIIKSGGGDQIASDIKASFSAIQGQANVSKKVDRASLEQTGLPILGVANAPITVVEFVDFKCPNCRAAAPAVEQMIAQSGGQVKLLVRHFPIESLHPGATNAALLAECSNQQGLFWPAFKTLFNNQDNLDTNEKFDPQDFAGLLPPVSLDRLAACVKDSAVRRRIEKDYVFALTAGVRGTPTFFINGQKVEGVIPLDSWKNIISQVSQTQK